MARTDNVKKNLVFNIIKYVTQTVLHFVLRTALIYIIGKEYLGLNSLFSNIFSFLNLAELGIGTAIAFSMYKPVAENDIEKIKTLQNLYRRFYLIISLIIFIVGVGLLPFLKTFIKGDVSAEINIYLLYAMYLINSIVGYFCAHKRAVLFAYQRNDIENKIKTICIILMSVIQVAILFIFRNYYIYFAVTILFTIIECICVQVVTNKKYPELKGPANPLDAITKKEISKNVVALSIQKVSGALIYSTDNILISAIVGISVLGVYSNYYLIISTIISIYVLLVNALTSSVGNMITSESVDYVYDKYQKLNLLFTIFTIFCTVCLFVLFQPFMNVWVRGDASYILEFSTVILLCVSFYIVRMRMCVIIFKDAAGLFWQNKFIPVVEAVLNIAISIVLGIFMGINGIILGTIISCVCAPMILEPRILYKHYFKKSVWLYVKQLLIDTIIMIVIAGLVYLVCSFIPNGGVWLFIAKLAVCVVLTLLLLLASYAPTKQFRETLGWLKGILKKTDQK